MTEKNLSVQAFKEFLDSLLTLDLVKEATARNLKNSSARLLTVVSEDEMDDVRKLNVDTLAQRYIRRTDPIPSPASMISYKSRTDSAIKKFIAYQTEDVIPYHAVDKESHSHSEVNECNELITENINVEEKVVTLPTYDLPVVLRPELGVTVTITGIPNDITKEEAERIASILKVYVRPQ